MGKDADPSGTCYQNMTGKTSWLMIVAPPRTIARVVAAIAIILKKNSPFVFVFIVILFLLFIYIFSVRNVFLFVDTNINHEVSQK